MFVASYAAVPVASLVAARDPSAHVAMSITDPTASSCSITKGLAARTETAARDPADCRAACEPGAADSDGGAAIGATVETGAAVVFAGWYGGWAVLRVWETVALRRTVHEAVRE